MILFAQIQNTTLFVISVRASMNSHASALVNCLIMRLKRKERARREKDGPSYLTISELTTSERHDLSDVVNSLVAVDGFALDVVQVIAL